MFGECSFGTRGWACSGRFAARWGFDVSLSVSLAFMCEESWCTLREDQSCRTLAFMSQGRGGV